jgi:aryl-alcohol dehydrogenase-like predicted oxidoreductase
MTNSILLQNVSPEQFTELMSNVFKTQLEEFKKNLNTNDPDILFTRAEACEFLKIEQTTLYHWVKAGKVQCYGIANRRFFKKSDLLNSLTLLKK